MINVFFTSYYGKIKAFDPEKYALISISGKPPVYWTGEKYRKLAPSWSIWNDWHNSREAAKKAPPEQRDELRRTADELYTARFKKEILGKLNPMDVLNDIKLLSNGKIPVLMCYEESFEFCHRHLVAKWLNDYSKAMRENNAGYDDNLLVREYIPSMDAVAVDPNPLFESKLAPCCKNCAHISASYEGTCRCTCKKRIEKKVEQALNNVIQLYGVWHGQGIDGTAFGCFVENAMENLKTANKLFYEWKDYDNLSPMMEEPNNISYCDCYDGNETDGGMQ